MVKKQRGRGRPAKNRPQAGRNEWANNWTDSNGNAATNGYGEYNSHLSERLGRGGQGMRMDALDATRPEEPKILPRHRLLEKLEQESTAHLPGWRGLSELPTPDELLKTEEEIEIAGNTIDGPYDSVEDYLSTHYELLREDAVAHLRQGVGYLRHNPDVMDSSVLAIYDSVRIIGFTWANTGVCAKVNFSLARAGKKIPWQSSKRLLPGSVVVLSCDNFDTVKVATVAARPLAGLKMPVPEVDLLFAENDIDIDTKKVYMMLETRSSYFEAYRHTLRSLQRIQEEEFPLAKHLANLDSNIEPPAYVREDPVYDLSCIFEDATEKEQLKAVNILEDFPFDIKSSMDRTQKEALHRMLTSSLAIVQGPPGTGKTFTSVIALKAIIANMRDSDPPIIVACQTNHALDQLLRHVIDFEGNVIRLGGRTQDQDKIKSRTLYEVRKSKNFQVQNQSIGRAKKQVEIIRRTMQELLIPLRSDILAPVTFYKHGLLTQQQCQSFSTGSDSWVSTENERNDPSNEIRYWLGRDNIEPIHFHSDDYLEYEEEDLEIEQLQEIEAEFLGGDQSSAQDFDDSLRGEFMGISHKCEARKPYDVTQAEVEASLLKEDVWSIPSHTRLAVYAHLRKRLLAKIQEEFNKNYAQYLHYMNSIRLAAKERDAYILQEAKVVGMTTTGLAKYRNLVASVQPRILMIEEAAESLEGHIMIGCTRTIQQVILVGDHKQLHGSCACKDLEEGDFNLAVSMFERLVKNNMPFTMLSQQRRMRPEIRQLVQPIYGDELQDHPLVYGRESVRGMGGKNVYFYTHEVHENVHDGTSRVNLHEADMVVGLANYLVHNGLEPEKITILTFYSGQRLQIYKRLRRHKHLGHFPIRAATVDSFQGEENDVILLSLVRSNLEGKIGFLSIENRVCVALSRARLGFYMFGNAKLVTTQNKLWWDIFKILMQEKDHVGCMIPIECVTHKNKLLIRHEVEWEETDGGCNMLCKEYLQCGHKCPLKCHPYSHNEVFCVERCEQVVQCGHPCSVMCRDRCSCHICEDPREQYVERTYAEFHPPASNPADDFALPSRYIPNGKFMETRDIRPHPINADPVLTPRAVYSPPAQPKVIYYDPEFSVTSVSAQVPTFRAPVAESQNLIDLDDDLSTPEPSASSFSRRANPSSPPLAVVALTTVVDKFPKEPPPPVPPAHTRPKRPVAEVREQQVESTHRRRGNQGVKSNTATEWPALGEEGLSQKKSGANWAQRAGRRG